MQSIEDLTLLSINRYLGEESQTTDNSQSKSFERLIESSKLRKKLRLSANCEHILERHALTESELTEGEKLDEEVVEEVVEGVVEGVVDDVTENVSHNQSDGQCVNDSNVSDDYFMVIGSEKRVKLEKVKPVLPKWIETPVVFDIKDNKSLDDYQHIISEPLISKLKQQQISSFFPVQQKVIPYLIKCFQNIHILRPRDICVSSPTGSGKTLSFVIPIVQHLSSRIVTHIRALIVLPVRDLAIQVFNVFERYSKETSLRVGLAIGHKSFDEEYSAIIRKSVNGLAYHSLVDILVATPGKLVDLIQRAPGFSLKYLDILVIDEADRMMSDVSFNWLQEIENCVFHSSAKYQCFCSVGHDSNNRFNVVKQCTCFNDSIFAKPIHKIMFSATLSTDPEKLHSLSLFEPILFMASLGDNCTAIESAIHTKHVIPIELQEFMVISEADRKPLIIYYLLEVLKYRKVLCFTGSVENTHRLYELLKHMTDIVVAEFSSKLNSKKRERLLNKFLNGKIDIIVCSDIFARGLDIDGIKCVICYDPPRNETAYIHRIGRTARAGNIGTAITLLSPTQLKHFNIVIRRVHAKRNSNNKFSIKKMIVKDKHLKPLQTKYKSALEKLSHVIREDKKKQIILKRVAIKY